MSNIHPMRALVRIPKVKVAHGMAAARLCSPATCQHPLLMNLKFLTLLAPPPVPVPQSDPPTLARHSGSKAFKSFLKTVLVKVRRPTRAGGGPELVSPPFACGRCIPPGAL